MRSFPELLTSSRRIILAGWILMGAAACDAIEAREPAALALEDFSGGWLGRWTAELGTAQQTGDLSFSVADGDVAGFGHNDSLSQAFAISGRLEADGGAALVYTYPDQVFQVGGPYGFDSDEHLVGAFEMKQGERILGTTSINLRDPERP